MARPHHLVLGDITTETWPSTTTSQFSVCDDTRLRHLHVIGQTGTGKSTLLLNLIAQDLAHGHGLGLIDPHGSLALAALEHVPRHRFDEVIYVDPTDPRPIGFNPLEGATAATAPTITENIVSAFLHVFDDQAIGHASQDVLRNALRALMFTPGSTLLGVLRMIEDERYRKSIARNIQDTVIESYWHVTVPSYSDRAWEDITRPILNKLRTVLSDPRCRNILGQSTSSFSLRRAMDEGHIVIANLSVGSLGEGVSHLIGALLSASFATTAFGRIDNRPDMKAPELKPYHLYVDEFHLFANTAYATILSQSRKFRLLLTMAHQYMEQLPPDLKSAILGNCGTTIAHRIGAEDAKELSLHLGLDQHYLEAEYKGHHQLMSLPNFQAFVRTLERGAPVTYRLFPYPDPTPSNPRPARVIANSSARFGRDKATVERAIERLYHQHD